MIIQLNPPIPVTTPKGKALAILLVDYGIEADLQWVCFQDKNGECWQWKNTQIRAQKNITHGRDYISPFYQPEDVAFKNDEQEDEEDDYEDNDDEIDKLELEISFLKNSNFKLVQQNHDLTKKSEETTDYLNKTSNSRANLSDYILHIISHKKIVKHEKENAIRILKNNGVCESDIKVFGMVKID